MSLKKEAWDVLRKADAFSWGAFWNIAAATLDPTEDALNYQSGVYEGLFSSRLAFLISGEPDLVKNLLLMAVQLQGTEKRVDCFILGDGVMPASFKNMTRSGAAFARKFDRDDAVLGFIDKQLLGRGGIERFTPGGWCIGAGAGEDPCGVRGDPLVLRPGPGARRLENLVLRLLKPDTLCAQQCVFT